MMNRMPITTTDALDGRDVFIAGGSHDPKNDAVNTATTILRFSNSTTASSQGFYMGRGTGMSKGNGRGI